MPPPPQKKKKKKKKLSYVSPGNLLIICYQVTQYEAASYKKFRDILITSFQCLNL